jgi:hypothetical protein
MNENGEWYGTWYVLASSPDDAAMVLVPPAKTNCSCDGCRGISSVWDQTLFCPPGTEWALGDWQKAEEVAERLLRAE